MTSVLDSPTTSSLPVTPDAASELRQATAAGMALCRVIRLDSVPGPAEFHVQCKAGVQLRPVIALLPVCTVASVSLVIHANHSRPES